MDELQDLYERLCKARSKVTLWNCRDPEVENWRTYSVRAIGVAIEGVERLAVSWQIQKREYGLSPQSTPDAGLGKGRAGI